MNRKLEHLIEMRTSELNAVNRRLRETNRLLERLAAIDDLTEVYRRREFFSQAGAEIARSIRYGTALSMVMLDLDHFKSINDRYGHSVGDQVLKAFSAYLRSQQRTNDIVGRLGGEEFGVLLPSTALDEATSYAERLRDGMSTISLEAYGVDSPLAASIGVAQFQPSDRGLEDLMIRADTALYEAKNAGRNRVVAV